MLIVSIVLVVAVVLMNLLWSWAFGQTRKYEPKKRAVVKMEMPMRLKDRPERILQKTDFVISFNPETPCAWLTGEGPRPRDAPSGRSPCP